MGSSRASTSIQASILFMVHSSLQNPLCGSVFRVFTLFDGGISEKFPVFFCVLRFGIKKAEFARLFSGWIGDITSRAAKENRRKKGIIV